MKNSKIHLKTFLKMKINNIILKFALLFFLLCNSVHAVENSTFEIGSNKAKITIEVFASLTCPHCAKLHLNVLPEIIKNYVDTKKVKIIFLDFPLDLAALNAAKIAKCVPRNNLEKYYNNIYIKQGEWTSGRTIAEINSKIKKIASETGITEQDFERCLKNDKNEETVLKSRIEAQKKYNISGTPTIIVNNKKYDGSYTYVDLAKYIDKLN